MASTSTPSMRRLVLLAATFQTTSAALALPSVLCATLDGDSSSKEKRKALQMLEDTVAALRRLFGLLHPETQRAQGLLEKWRKTISGPAAEK